MPPIQDNEDHELHSPKAPKETQENKTDSHTNLAINLMLLEKIQKCYEDFEKC